MKAIATAIATGLILVACGKEDDPLAGITDPAAKKWAQDLLKDDPVFDAKFIKAGDICGKRLGMEPYVHISPSKMTADVL
jgi:hypothetical protein